MKATNYILGLLLYASLSTAVITARAEAAIPDNATLEAQFNAAHGHPAAKGQLLGSIMAPEVSYTHNYGRHPDDGVPKPREVIMRTQGAFIPANAPPLPYSADQEDAIVTDHAIVLTWRMNGTGADGKPMSTLFAQIWKRNKEGLIVSGTVYYDDALFRELLQLKSAP